MLRKQQKYLESKIYLEDEIWKLKKRLKKLTDNFAIVCCPVKIGDIIENSAMRIRVESIILDNSFDTGQWWKAKGQRLTKSNSRFRNANLPEIITFPTDLSNPRCNVKIIEVD